MNTELSLKYPVAGEVSLEHWRPRPLRPMPRAAVAAYHALTSLLVVMATATAYVAALIVGFNAEACSIDGLAAASTGVVHAELAVIGLAWAAVPAGAGLVARRYRMRGRAWFGLAAVMTVAVVAVAAAVDPAMLCR